MFKILGFFFDGALGKSVLIFALVGSLFGAWQVERHQQRQVGALQAEVKHQAAQAKEAEAINAHLETAAGVRDAAERAARGERVRNIKRDPYHEPAKAR